MPCFDRRLPAVVAIAGGLLALPAAAQEPAFHPGPVFANLAPIATIDSDMAIPTGALFKVALDDMTQAHPGSVNDSFLTAARFINAHVEAGVPAGNISIGIVVHSRAILDLLTPEAYASRNGGAANASARAVADLLAHNVNFYVCGQSAVAQGIAKSELLPGVKMAISASSAHALLQMQGYSINPF